MHLPKQRTLIKKWTEIRHVEFCRVVISERNRTSCEAIDSERRIGWG